LWQPEETTERVSETEEPRLTFAEIAVAGLLKTRAQVQWDSQLWNIYLIFFSKLFILTKTRVITMSSSNNVEQIMFDQITRLFRFHRYQCQTQYNLEDLTGYSIIVDVFCERSVDDLVIVKTNTEHFDFSLVKQLVVLRMFPKLARTKFYLAVPKTFDFMDKELLMMVVNDIRIARIEQMTRRQQPLLN
jgi:hypothetical protein